MRHSPSDSGNWLGPAVNGAGSEQQTQSPHQTAAGPSTLAGMRRMPKSSRRRYPDEMRTGGPVRPRYALRGDPYLLRRPRCSRFWFGFNPARRACHAERSPLFPFRRLLAPHGDTRSAAAFCLPRPVRSIARLDLKGVNEIDSTGLGTLAFGLSKLRKAGGRWRCHAGLAS
jgi:hypothetical protein